MLIDNYEHVEDNVVYCPVNIPGIGADVTLFEEQFEGCQCLSSSSSSSSSCVADQCACQQRCGGSAYSQQGLLLFNDAGDASSMVYECHENCQCISNRSNGSGSVALCSNYVVQRGPHPDLEVFSAPSKGFYGLRCRKSLPRGKFVCEYAGEVIGGQEARRRYAAQQQQQQHPLGGRNFIFALRENFGSSASCLTFIDATCIGSIGRYINHGCEPNLIVLPVRTDSSVPKLCLFTNQEIPACTELCYDYAGGRTRYPPAPTPSSSSPSPAQGSTMSSHLVGPNVCRCGSPACRGFLPFDASLGTSL